jgi:hypothetical protein
MHLSTALAFEQERMLRAIDSTTDVLALQCLCKKLLQAWMTQRAATTWAMRHPLPGPSQPLPPG